MPSKSARPDVTLQGDTHIARHGGAALDFRALASEGGGLHKRVTRRSGRCQGQCLLHTFRDLQ